VNILINFTVSLFLTLIIEIIVAFFFRMRGKYEILLVVLVNILTNPAVNFLNLCGRGFAWWNVRCQILLEIIAIAVEALVYFIFSRKEDWNIAHPVWLAVLANAISYGIGCAINAIVVL